MVALYTLTSKLYIRIQRIKDMYSSSLPRIVLIIAPAGRLISWREHIARIPAGRLTLPNWIHVMHPKESPSPIQIPILILLRRHLDFLTSVILFGIGTGRGFQEGRVRPSLLRIGPVGVPLHIFVGTLNARRGALNVGG